MLLESCRIILYFVLITKHIRCKLQPIQIDAEVLTLEDTINGILSEVIRPNKSVLIINSEDIIFYAINKLARNFTIFNLNTNDLRTFNLIDGSLIETTICFSKSPINLDTVLKTVKYIFANNAKQFTVIVDSSKDLEDKVTPHYFEVLWQHNYIKTLITRISENGTRPIVDIFNWNALAPSALCGRNPFTYEKNRIYRSEKNRLNFSHLSEMYQNMTPPKQAIHCKIKVGVSVYPPSVFPAEKLDPATKEYIFNRGFEIKLIQTIANKLRLEIKFQSFNLSRNGDGFDENGAATGLFKTLLEGDLDIGLSSFTFMTRNECIDFGPPYAVEDIIWCVPKALPSQPQLRLLYPFGFTIFILYLIASILTSSAICLLSTFRKSEPKFNQKLENCLFRYVADMFGTSYSLNTPKSFGVRVLHIMWLFTKLHMITLYCSTIFSFFTVHKNEQKYKTLTDVLNSNLRLLISSNKFPKIAKDIFTENRISTCSSVEDCLERVAVFRDSALILSKYEILKKHRLAIDCQIRKNLMSFPITMIIRKNHFIINLINREILHLIQAGLISYWKREALETADHSSLNNAPKSDFLELDETPYIQVITYRNLEPVFNIWLAGQIISIFIFLIELGLYYKSNNFKRHHIEFRQ